MARSQRSLKIQTTVLRFLQSRGQSSVAEFMGVSEATVSTLVNKQLPNAPDGTTYLTRFSDVFAAIGLKAVPEDAMCVSRKKMETLQYLATIGLRHVNVEEEDNETERMLFGDRS